MDKIVEKHEKEMLKEKGTKNIFKYMIHQRTGWILIRVIGILLIIIFFMNLNNMWLGIIFFISFLLVALWIWSSELKS